jgi:hypothetical protein
MVTTGKQSDAEPEAKRVTYPYATYSKSLEIAVAVRDLGGSNTDVQRSVIAHKLRVDQNSTALLQNITSAKTFDMLAGRGSYHLTETAKRYFFPTEPGEKQRAMLRMIGAPIIFQSLINRFDGGRVPDSETLVNILHREHKVSQSWRPRVATLFLSTLREAQVIDGAGFLRYAASMHSAGNGTMASMRDAPVAEHTPEPSSPVATQPADRAIPTQGGVTTWHYKGGILRVETPENLSYDVWKKLYDYVAVLKPEEGEQQ